MAVAPFTHGRCRSMDQPMPLRQSRTFAAGFCPIRRASPSSSLSRLSRPPAFPMAGGGASSSCRRRVLSCPIAAPGSGRSVAAMNDSRSIRTDRRPFARRRARPRLSGYRSSVLQTDQPDNIVSMDVLHADILAVPPSPSQSLEKSSGVGQTCRPCLHHRQLCLTVELLRTEQRQVGDLAELQLVVGDADRCRSFPGRDRRHPDGVGSNL